MAAKRSRWPRSPRRIITCSVCGKDKPHQAHGWCLACDTRWRYYGRPAGGPPAPGEGLPPRGTVPHTCPSSGTCGGCDLDRAWTEHRAFRDRNRDRWRASAERRNKHKHLGHNVVTTNGMTFCLGCKRGETSMDEMAVARAVMGDPPDRLSPAEREAAVIQLRLSTDLSYPQIAERIGCSSRTAIRICKANGLTRNRMEVAA